MKPAAIDLGGKESRIRIRQPDGTIVEERKYSTKKLPRLMASWPPSRIVMETCAEAFRLADGVTERESSIASARHLLGGQHRGSNE